MLKKIEEFELCLVEERFYDAHEALEEIWFPRRYENSAEMSLLKGFINAAVSFELVNRQRIPQSKKVWKNYLKYRQLLFKTETIHLNRLYQLSRFIEETHKSILL